MAVLVAYATKHGSTSEIARTIGERLVEQGLDVQVRSVDAVNDVGGFDAVVLGSAVYMGSWRKGGGGVPGAKRESAS